MPLKVAFDKDGEVKYIIGDRVREATNFLEVYNENDELIGQIPYDKLTYVIGEDVTLDE